MATTCCQEKMYSPTGLQVVAGCHQVKLENFKVKVVPCHTNQHVRKGKTFTLKVNSLPFSLHFTFNSFTSTPGLQQLTGDQINLKEVSGAALYSYQRPSSPNGCNSSPGLLFQSAVRDLDKIINTEKYSQISIHRAIPCGNNLIANGFIFQHDNNPKYTASEVKAHLNRKIHQS